MECCLLLMAVAVGGDVGGVIFGSGNVCCECFMGFFVGSEVVFFFDWPIITFIGGSALPWDDGEHSGRHCY